MYIRAYASEVASWNEDKAAANVDKRGVDFADAVAVLEDEMALTMEDSEHEGRWLTLGMDALGRILVVSYTWQEEEPRLISARPASRHQRKQYESKR